MVCVQIEPVKLCTVYCAGKEIVPRITESILQHHVTGTAEIVIQLCIIVLHTLRNTEIGIIRITNTLKCDDLIDTVSVLMDAVNGDRRR